MKSRDLRRQQERQASNDHLKDRGRAQRRCRREPYGDASTSRRADREPEHERREHARSRGHGVSHQQSELPGPDGFVNEGRAAGDHQRRCQQESRHCAAQSLPIVRMCCSSRTALDSIRCIRWSFVPTRATS